MFLFDLLAYYPFLKFYIHLTINSQTFYSLLPQYTTFPEILNGNLLFMDSASRRPTLLNFTLRRDADERSEDASGLREPAPSGLFVLIAADRAHVKRGLRNNGERLNAFLLYYVLNSISFTRLFYNTVFPKFS